MAVITPGETYITKLQLRDKHIYVKLVWIKNDSELFHIQIFDGDCSWSGRFSNEFAQKFREKDNISETHEQYSSNVKKCLIGEGENYTYDFSISMDDCDTAAFSWKRRFEGATILHGKVPVHRDLIPQSKEELVDILLGKNSELKIDMKELQTHTDNLIVELDKCKNELEKYVNIKTSLEATLYGKFVLLLNAKKRRIQLLEDNLLNFEEPNNITMGNELD